MNSKPRSPEPSSLDDALAQQTASKGKSSLMQATVAVVTVASLGLAYVGFSWFGKGDSSSAPAASQETQLSPAEQEKQREAFKQVLLAFEQSYQSWLQKDYVQAFDGDEFSRITNLQETALAAFARGEFRVANAQLKDASSKAEAMQAAWQQQFETHYSEVSSAFASKDIAKAKFAYQQAYQLNPEAEKLLALGKRLDVYGSVEQALSAYQAAVIENNITKQIDALQLAMTLDPARTDLQPLLNSARQSQQVANTRSLLQQANAALDKNELTKAGQLLQQARQLSPNDGGVKTAQARLVEKQQTRALLDQLRGIQQHIQDDNWPAVQASAEGLLAKDPTNANLRELKDTAQQINQTQAQLEGFLQRKAAMRDGKFRQKVKQAITAAEQLAQQSPSLSQLSQQLRSEMQVMETPLELVITSDGKTAITIFKVARLGQIERTVQALLPGSYRIEGKCSGYQTVLKTVLVRPGVNPQPLHLVCEKRI